VKVSKARKLKGILNYCDCKGCGNKRTAKIHDIRDNQFNVCNRHKREMSARYKREAVSKLVEFYNDYRKCQSDPVYNACGHHYAYIDNLLNINCCLQKKDFVTAYVELRDLLYDKSYLQNRVYYPLMQMLKKNLGKKHLYVSSKKKPISQKSKKFDREDFTPDLETNAMSRKEKKREFDYVMFQVNCFLCVEPAHKKDIAKNAIVNINTVVNLIKDDLKYDLYSVNMDGNDTGRMAFIPHRYRDENGIYRTTKTNNKNDLNIHLNTSDSVFYTQTVPYYSKVDAGCQVEYYQYLDMFHIRNSNNSYITGDIQETNVIQSRYIYDITRMFAHVWTNGSEWINVHNDKIIADVIDFRVAILYAFARIKYFIERCGKDKRKIEEVLISSFDW